MVMNITDVKTDIKNKKIKPYYIFAGEEIEIQRIYINKIAEVLDYSVVRVDHIADVWAEIISPTLFGKSCVYVVRDDKDLQEDILSAQIERNNLNGNIIINLLTTVDKRTKFYKANSDKIVLFERLSDEVLKKYIKKEITLNNANCERLIAICESDYSRILLEIDKIKRYLMEVESKVECQSRYDTAFEKLVEDGTIAVPPQDAIFDLVDAILKRQRKRVYDLLEQCYAVGEANMVILSVLYNNAKQVLQVQACEDKDVCGTTGLTSWQVKCAREKCGHYSIDELFNILKLVQEVQKGIITGQIEDEMSVQYLLVNIL
jgi:DNA polymerase III delta subunit